MALSGQSARVSMRQDLGWVLLDLCREWGYCGAVREQERARFIDDPPADVDEFTDRVIIAEGMDPALMQKADRRRLRLFIEERWDGTA